MSQKSRILFGVAAIALTLGAIPLAAGRDLAGDVFNRSQDVFNRSQPVSSTLAAGVINRAAKADRAGSAVRSEVATRTISLQFNGLADTSVLVRVPVAQAARPSSFAPSWSKSDKRAVACEPVVSVLTEVAKRLEPGSCVT
ncbi:MAG: hypothetical protein WCA28_28100 [Bradyrhizobium sp.]